MFEMKKISLWLWLALCCLPMNSHALDIMLPQVYTDSINVSNWLMSEKLDGIRGYWEGEIWGGRGTFEKTLSIVKKQQAHDGWLELKFAVFDVPQATGGFTRRLQKAKSWFNHHPAQFAFVIPQKTIKDKEELKTELHSSL